jgi:uncharacterized protein YggE
MRRMLATMAVMMMLVSTRSLAEEQPRTINTSGESSVYVAPDEVVVNVGIETFDAQLDQAKSANDQAAESLLKAIKAMGIEDKHIQTSNLDIELRYHQNRPEDKIVGFVARRSYAVTLKEVKSFEKLIDVALKNGANRMMGFEFRNTELRKYRDQARKMAIKAAKEKAQDLAGELGCKIGSPRNISEGSMGYLGYHGGWGGNSYMTQNSVQMNGGGGEGGETMPLGQIAIRASVSVTFDLVP